MRNKQWLRIRRNRPSRFAMQLVYARAADWLQAREAAVRASRDFVDADLQRAGGSK